MAGALVLALAGGEAVRAAESREAARLQILDLCVMAESSKRQDLDKIADECKCAAAKAVKDMSDAEIAAFKGKFPKDTLPVWEKATQACFKSLQKLKRPG